MKKFNQIYVENLVNNIEKFYKRFYFNKLYKGLAITIALVILVFLVVNFFVFYGELSGNMRFTLFYTYIFIVLAIFYSQVMVPILQLFRLKEGISKKLAAKYIGDYFPEIKDKLINTIEFMELSSPSSLALASIKKRSRAFDNFEFEAAVIPMRLKILGIILVIPLVIFVSVFLTNSEVISTGTYKLLNYDKEFVPDAPFQFMVSPGNFNAIAGADVSIKLSLSGNELPNEAFIELNGVNYRMRMVDGYFYYNLVNVRSNFDYRIKAGSFHSKNFVINVAELPRITELRLEVIYPKYTGLPSQEFSNISRLELPFGSIINWKFVTKEAGNLNFLINKIPINITKTGAQKWEYSSEIKSSFDYSIDLIDGFNGIHEGENHHIRCLTDTYPSISVNAMIDSTGMNQSLFFGRIADDYGFKDVSVILSNTDSTWNQPIDFDSQNGNGTFSYVLDHSIVENASTITFGVRDNDKFNGFKLTVSTPVRITILSEDDKNKLELNEKNKIIADIEKLAKDSKLLDKDIKDLNKELLTKRNLDWENQNKANNIQKKFRDLQKKNEDINERIRNSTDETIREDQTIVEKERQLEELFDKLLNDKTKELFKELEELMKNLNKENLQQHLEKMALNQDDISKELDRNLEIFKQLELEQGLEKAMEKIIELSVKQEELSVKNGNLAISNEKNLEEQEKLSREFEDIVKDLQRLDSLNKELKDPNKLDLDKKAQEEILNSQKSAEQKSKAGKQKESSEEQKNASEKMKQLEQKVKESFETGSSNQEGEDLESMRKLLENLLVLSFDQENLMEVLKSLDITDPSIVNIGQKQQELINSSEMVKDSLFALSVRVPQINDLVTTETTLITSNMENSLETLSDRKISKTLYHNQKALTSINNLAVLIDEIIQQMQEQQKNKKKGTGSCSKPGEGSPKPSLKSSKKKQDELAKKMAAMKKKLEKGNKPGHMNPGRMGEGMSKEIAEMAAQQEIIREELRKMMNELQKAGDLGAAGKLKELEELMDKNETDIINLNLDQEFLNRQKDIESKLLKAENSERERELDSQRKSEQNAGKENVMNKQLEEYLKVQKRELELLRLSNPNLNGFYKTKVKQYNSSMSK